MCGTMCGAYRLMPFSLAVSPALRPCSTTWAVLAPCRCSRRAGVSGDQEVAEGPCGAHDERVAALAHQVEAQIGDIHIRSSLPGLGPCEQVANPLPGIRIADRARQCQREKLRVRAQLEACARSSNVNETGLDALNDSQNRRTTKKPNSAANMRPPFGSRNRRRMRSYGQPGMGIPICEPAGSSRTAGAGTPSPQWPGRMRRSRRCPASGVRRLRIVSHAILQGEEHRLQFRKVEMHRATTARRSRPMAKSYA